MTIVSFTPTQTSANLTTLLRVKEELNLESDSEQDGRIGRLIERASARVASYLQRELRRGAVIEALEPVDSHRLHLRIFPVLAVSEVLEDGAEIASGEDGYLLESKARGVLYRRIRWWAQLPTLWGISETRSPERGKEIYQVTYTAGYFLPDWTGTPAADDVLLPRDIEDATIELVREAFYRRERNPAVLSERLGDWSATYRGTTERRDGLPAEVADLLSTHRRIVQG